MRRDIRAPYGFSSLAKRFFASFVFACVLVGTGYTGFARVFAAVAPPRILMYQGRLLNSNGVPVSDSTASISFALYDAATAGTCLWSNNSATCTSVVARTVTLTSGLFSEALGDTTASTPYAAIAATVFADNASVYLEVVVAGETLTPRKAMLAAPYAMNADTLDGYSSSTIGGTSSIVPVTDVTGNLVITGSPQGSGVSQGSLYINPATGVVAANEILLGIAVSGTAQFIVDGEGDGFFTGDVSINGGDLSSTAASFNFLNANVTTLTMASSATVLDMNNSAVTSTINIGGSTANGANTVNIATNSTTADSIAIGNSNAGTLVTVTGGDDWSISSAGLITTAGNLAVNGGGISSTAALAITSSSGNISLGPNGSGLAYVTGGDDFAVGSTSIIAPFSVDESANTVRIGDGANDAVDPTLTFYASDATDTGSLSYTDEDIFNFSGGNISFTGLGTLPTVASNALTELSAVSTYSGTSGSTLDTIQMYGVGSSTTYSAIENAVNTDHYVGANNNLLTISGATATITRGYGSRNRLTNTSTNASLLQTFGYLTAIEAEYSQSAAATTVATAYGVHGTVSSAAGTITSGSAIIGEVTTSAGTITTGYAGRFLAVSAGTNRYGLFADASGGTTNYSGYFTGSQLQVDADSTADTPTYANASGELYVSGDIENRGNVSFGDTTGEDQFLFTSAIAAGDATTMTASSLTSGTVLKLARAAGGADFDGTVLTLNQLNTSATSDATALSITNSGAGNSIGLKIVQNTLSAHSANATGNNALVLDVNEASGSENVMIIRSDADGTPDTEFRVESDGEVFADGALVGTGADYAEYFKTTDAGLGGYHVVCQDPSMSEAVHRCSAGDTTYVMGVVSTNAAFVGNNFRGASYDMSNDPNYRKIGMVGQIDTFVNAGEGAIAVGDAITTSMTMSGYGAKLHGPARIVGFALEPLAAGTGVIRVLVQPQWYGGDVLTSTGSATQVAGSLAIATTTAATASLTAVDSASLSLRGSAWSGGSAQTVGMSLNTVVTAVNDYRLSVTNTAGTEVASVNHAGDLAIAGKLYPSDRGAAQNSKYIYYDGSSGSGGDFMRTNSSGWATGSYDFAEMFPSPDALMPGEIVVFGDGSQQVKRSTGETYSRTIAGIVSTRPGFLAGSNSAGNYPVALAGRVPTFVSTENGAINIGDPLTTSAHPGYAMKATEAGPILGYAAESFAGSMGSIVAYVNVSYYSGAPVAEGPAANNSISHLAQDIENFDTAGILNFNGGQLLAIGSMSSASGAWRLERDGNIVTSGRLIELVRSAQGTDVETYAATSRQMTVQISGTVNLVNGRADVHFADIDPSFVDIVDVNPTYRALVTPYGATGALYVTNRTVDGFSIVESGAASNGISVDWLVLATRRDYAPISGASEMIVAPAAPSVFIDPDSNAGISAPSDSGSSSSEPEVSGEIVAPVIVPDAVVDVPDSVDAESATVVSDAPEAVSEPSNSAEVSSGTADSSSGGSDSAPAPTTP